MAAVVAHNMRTRGLVHDSSDHCLTGTHCYILEGPEEIAGSQGLSTLSVWEMAEPLEDILHLPEDMFLFLGVQILD